MTRPAARPPPARISLPQGVVQDAAKPVKSSADIAVMGLTGKTPSDRAREMAEKSRQV